MAHDTVWKWERGESVPDLTSFDLVANALGVKPWDLIEFTEDDTEAN